MTDLVRIERYGSVGLIEIDHPPVNALAQPVRGALLAAIEMLEGTADVAALVIHGAGRQFIAGADVREFDHAPRTPLLNDVLLRLEACDKPVIAALHGATLGGGAELALASHYRAAAPDLQLGFPEIKLGLLPGAGGTVRLPRFIGTRAALDLMLSGEPVRFDRALELGLIDRELSGDLKAAALAYAHELIEQGAPVRRTRDRSAPPLQEISVCTETRAQLAQAARKTAASERIVDAVEATLTLPFDAALAEARRLFEGCRTSVESRALRHLFFAERGASTRSEETARVEHIGVVGAGTMGSGIAISALSAGFHVTLVDANAGMLDAAQEKIFTALDAAVRKGRMAAAAAESARRRLRPERSIGALQVADLVIEAVFESLPVKQEVFAELGRSARPGAVLATNTSTLDVDAIAAASGRPVDVVGMHFFSPAHVMRLVEIVRGAVSSTAAVATVTAVTRRLGKIGIEVGNAFGFVGNRMLYEYGREKELLLLEGASVAQIDRALEAFGMAMGPNAVGDLAGLEIGCNARRAWRDRPDDPRYYRVSDLLVEQGRFGQKNGKGFYRYEASGRRAPDPQVEDLIRAEAERLGIERRAVTDEEIVERCVLALINAGAKLLEDGIARHAADIDVIWCNGYGFPRVRGGPMFYADTLGLQHVRERITGLRARYGPRFWPHTAVSG